MMVMPPLVEHIVADASRASKNKGPTGPVGRWMRDAILSKIVFPMISAPAEQQRLYGYRVDTARRLADIVAEREAAAAAAKPWYRRVF